MIVSLMKIRIESNTFKGLLVHLGIVLMLFLLLSFVFIYKVLPIAVNKDNVVTVPDVNGLSLADAINFLEGKGLNYQVTDSAYNPELPSLAVLDQFPKPMAKVKINRKISLKLNAKVPPEVTYPDFSGTTFEFAQKRLKFLGLKMGAIKYESDFAHNTILESRNKGTAIHAGQKIARGSVIDFTLASSIIKFALPDFSGMPLDEVEMYLAGTGLKVKEIHAVEDPGKHINNVLKQIPQSGDTVQRGDSIELWIYNFSKSD